MVKRLLFAIMAGFFLLGCNNETKQDANDETSSAEVKPKPAVELLDMATTESLKASYDAFSKGDMDGFTANMEDNVRFHWSGGDSLVGKQAIKDYYAGRWQLIDSLNFSDHIFLPIQSNESQSPIVETGKWILHWSFVHVKYKNGKKLDFWVHQVNHYDDGGKVDYIGQYIDRAPLAEATRGM